MKIFCFDFSREKILSKRKKIQKIFWAKFQTPLVTRKKEKIFLKKEKFFRVFFRNRLTLEFHREK